MKLLLKDCISDYVDVSNFILNRSFNKKLIHQVLLSYIALSKKGTKAQKSRSNVSGSGKKPWKQKGTGRARVGSIRSPIWRSGGVTFAAEPKKSCVKINKKMYNGAMKSIFSELIIKNKIIIFKKFCITYPKTKLLMEKLKFTENKKTLVILNSFDKNLFLASRNIDRIMVIEVRFMNPLVLLSYDLIVTTVDTFKKIENNFNEI
ncbi:50S ribosomal protein L4 [Buchnera aphidicola (Chaitoregma tattakana)]|uniref:50S ribosomal protein L4 n=1 Tax=Buchnera aphidicola TaxID=9 RepID=UPI0031B82B96